MANTSQPVYGYVVATSGDLIHWKTVASGDNAPRTDQLLVSPTGVLLAHCSDGLRTSADAITWTRVPNVPFEPPAVSISAGPRGLVAATGNPDIGSYVWYSADGLAWTWVKSAEALVENYAISDVFAGPTGFFVTGEIVHGNANASSTGEGVGWWSSDGLTWQRAVIADASDFGGDDEVHLASKGMFMRERGGAGQWHSIDGTLWLKTPESDKLKTESGDDYGITYVDGGDRTIAFDCSSACRAWETFDGSTWKKIKITIPKSAQSDVADMLPNSVFGAFTRNGITLYCSAGGMMGSPVVAKVIRIAAAP
jgi:hypothetical protein